MCTISIVWKRRNGFNVKRSLPIFFSIALNKSQKNTGAKRNGGDLVLCDFGVAYAKGVDYNKTIFINDAKGEGKRHDR